MEHHGIHFYDSTPLKKEAQPKQVSLIPPYTEWHKKLNKPPHLVLPVVEVEQLLTHIPEQKKSYLEYLIGFLTQRIDGSNNDEGFAELEYNYCFDTPYIIESKIVISRVVYDNPTRQLLVYVDQTSPYAGNPLSPRWLMKNKKGGADIEELSETERYVLTEHYFGSFEAMKSSLFEDVESEPDTWEKRQVVFFLYFHLIETKQAKKKKIGAPHIATITKNYREDTGMSADMVRKHQRHIKNACEEEFQLEFPQAKDAVLYFKEMGLLVPEHENWPGLKAFLKK